jgi:predicted class III extradiol MEMO1 family dioxygenase
MRPIQRAAGILSPHIDFARGGTVYAATWQAALPAVASADLVVVFGTDHHGSAGRWTTTLQRYATPWGTLPADESTVSTVAATLGEELAFDEELHHVREHSIELAVVWLHWTLRRAGVANPPPVIPILCGSFHCFTRPASGSDSEDKCSLPEDDAKTAAALDALASAMRGRRVLVVSAADLAHVGPAFGDEAALDSAQKADLALADEDVLRAARSGDAGQLLARLRAEQDRRRVCGLPPTYWSLRLLERLAGRVDGRLAGYDVCPADAGGSSVVTIAGMLWE